MPFSMPPGLRIPYDSDGSIGLLHPSVSLGGGVLDVHPLALQAMNSTMGSGLHVPTTYWAQSDSRPSDTTDIDAANYPYICLIFPVPMRIRGIFFSRASEYNFNAYDGSGDPPSEPTATDRILVESSPDSTNSVDGEWNSLGLFTRGLVPFHATATAGISAVSGATQMSTTSSFGRSRGVKDVYRKLHEEESVGIQAVAGSATRQIRALRLYPIKPSSDGVDAYPAGYYFLHVYGEPDTEAVGENYLQGWRADSDMRLGGATLSWGDVPLGSSADKTFRIKNQSDSDTANSVVVSAEDALYYPVPSPAQQFAFSLDGITWTPTVTIGAIGPEAVSPTIYMRRVTPSNAPLTTYSPKVHFLVTGGWS